MAKKVRPWTKEDVRMLKGTSNNDDFFVGLIAGATGR
jgi:hypothetical protein